MAKINKISHMWLKSIKLASMQTKLSAPLFSYNMNVNLPIMKIGNNKINETSVTKFLGIHLDKKIEFCKSYN